MNLWTRFYEGKETTPKWTLKLPPIVAGTLVTFPDGTSGWVNIVSLDTRGNDGPLQRAQYDATPQTNWANEKEEEK